MSRGRRSIFIGNEWHIHIHGTGGKTESSGREGEVHVQREEATSTSLEDGGGGRQSYPQRGARTGSPLGE